NEAGSEDQRSESRCKRSEAFGYLSVICHLASPHGVARGPATVALVDRAAVDVAVVGEAGIAEAAVRIGRVPGGKARAARGRSGRARLHRHGDIGAARVLAADRLDLEYVRGRGSLDTDAHRKRSGRGRPGHRERTCG